MNASRSASQSLRELFHQHLRFMEEENNPEAERELLRKWVYELLDAIDEQHSHNTSNFISPDTCESALGPISSPSRACENIDSGLGVDLMEEGKSLQTELHEVQHPSLQLCYLEGEERTVSELQSSWLPGQQSTAKSLDPEGPQSSTDGDEHLSYKTSHRKGRCFTPEVSTRDADNNQPMEMTKNVSINDDPLRLSLNKILTAETDSESDTVVESASRSDRATPQFSCLQRQAWFSKKEAQKKYQRYRNRSSPSSEFKPPKKQSVINKHKINYKNITRDICRYIKEEGNQTRE